jgi:hypothetical protein
MLTAKSAACPLCKTSADRSGAGLPDFPCYDVPKLAQIYQMITNYTKRIPNNYKLQLMTVKHTKSFHSKAFQNIAEVGFLV